MRSWEVRRVLQTGRRLYGRRVVVLLAPGSGDSAVIAARRIGGAVERNRARRLLRAALREVRWQVDETDDVVLVARSDIKGCGARDLVAEMTELLRV